MKQKLLPSKRKNEFKHLFHIESFGVKIAFSTNSGEALEAVKKAVANPYFQGILDVTEEELVSTDFIGNSHSAIVDLNLTAVIGGNMLKVVAWYDNEWGYSNRLVEVVADAGKILAQNGAQPAAAESACGIAQPEHFNSFEADA